MRLNKKLEEEIDRAIKIFEKEEKENKLKLYTQEEMLKFITGGDYINRKI